MSSTATTNAGSKAALMLREKLGASKTILPEDARPDSGKYGTDFYFITQSSQIVPACRVLPENAADISETLKIVREAGATFAVKAGGHCSYASGTNAENGITIDFSRLKDITVSDDRRSVIVGAGCRFGELYHKLEAHQVGCVGGRISSVGVSGLTMGGEAQDIDVKGICVNKAPIMICSYELVLANGDVLNVTKKSHPDLFWGMRGAGITFGIVTRFELKTFDLGEIWGGASAFAHEHGTAILEAFNKFMHENPDPHAEAFLIATDAARDGNIVYVMIMSHSNPRSEITAFDDFKRLTPLFSSTQNRTLKNFCDEMESQNEPGLRYRTTSMSVKCHLPTLKQIAAIHDETVALLKDCEDFVPSLLYQPLLEAMHSRDDVDNTLGIKPEDTPLMDISLIWRWTDIQHDARISQVADQFVEKVEKAARAQGTFHRYQYLNYAADHQDVYGGYGEENRKRLLKISAKYDPEGLMPKMRPGIIQLSGPQKA